MTMVLLGATTWFNKRSAIKCACEWARLNPLPVPASKVHVQAKGSGATREFIVTFTGERAVILAWLKDSPGTQGAYSDVEKSDHFHRRLSPGGGAQFAEITVFASGTKVVIRTYWS